MTRSNGEDVYIYSVGEKLAYNYTNEDNGLVLRRQWRIDDIQAAQPKDVIHPLLKFKLEHQTPI